jgi:hypothetical protein
VTRNTRRSAAFAALIALATPGFGRADVRIVVGATPIPNGDAKSRGDLTVLN